MKHISFNIKFTNQKIIINTISDQQTFDDLCLKFNVTNENNYIIGDNIIYIFTRNNLQVMFYKLYFDNCSYIQHINEINLSILTKCLNSQDKTVSFFKNIFHPISFISNLNDFYFIFDKKFTTIEINKNSQSSFNLILMFKDIV